LFKIFIAIVVRNLLKLHALLFMLGFTVLRKSKKKKTLLKVPT
jgi:hypothetical protein